MGEVPLYTPGRQTHGWMDSLKPESPPGQQMPPPFGVWMHACHTAHVKNDIPNKPKEEDPGNNVQGYLTYKKTHPPRSLP